MSAMDAFWAAPPVSRTLTAAAVLLSFPTHLGLISPFWTVFLSYRILAFPPEIWRLVTSLILTGPQLDMLMAPYFLYTYGSQVEMEALSAPGDFFVYVVVVSVVILLTGGFYLQAPTLLGAFTLAIARTYSLQNPDRMMSFFIVTFAAKWLPFAMIAVTCVAGSPYGALVQSTGLLGAHAYDFLARIWPEYGGGRRWIETPPFVRRWFLPAPGTAQRRAYGTAMPSAGQQNADRNANRAGWASGTAWDSRGAGRRLG